MSFLTWLFKLRRSTTVRLEAFGCDQSVRIDKPIVTPGLSRVTRISFVLDIDYVVERDQPVIKAVSLSRLGASIGGGKHRVNVMAVRTGEAWYQYSFSPKELLWRVAEMELTSPHSPLRKIMIARWRDIYSEHYYSLLARAINSKMSDEQLSQLIERLWRRERNLEFEYEKSDGNVSQRRVFVQSIENGLLATVDLVDGKYRTFRIDRMRNIRPIIE